MSSLRPSGQRHDGPPRFIKMLKNSCNNIFMVQADGAPMSGGSDDYRTTLQAVAMADIVDKANITPYIFISGGTNSKTKKTR